MLVGETAKLVLNLQNGRAAGGNGFAGGGGGMGAGGGVYVDLSQTLTLTNTTIQSCAAAGGNGSASSGITSSGGGGGGASFSIATRTASAAAGGGDYPGLQPTGGGQAYPGTLIGYGGGAGGYGAFGGGGGGSGSGSNAPNTGYGGGGGYCGGGGGVNTGALGGGGGGGGNPGGSGYDGGANLGGGGGGGYDSGGAGGDVTSGSGAYGGGGGGFGGGGGSGGYSSSGAYLSGGGGGGFGAGAGGGANFGGVGSVGGRFGGNGNTSGSATVYGGGGGGIGGAIFVGDTAGLSIENGVSIPSASSTVTAGASGGGTAAAGTPYATDVFLFKGAYVTFNGSMDLTAAFAIQCDTTATGSGLDAGVIVNTLSNSNVITLSSTSNNYQGGTTITRGILAVNSTNNLPSTGAISIATNGTLRILGSYAPTVAVTNAGAIDIPTGGAFTVPGTFTNSGGAIYVSDTGNLTGTITAGSSLNIGKTSTGTVSAKAFSASNPITVTAINVYNGSSLATAGNAVTSNLYMNGTSTFSGSNISGSTLTIGQDSFGTLDGSTSFLSSQAISTFPTINVLAGAFASNSFAISNVNTAFTVATGATATLTSAFTGSGAATIAGTMNINTNGNFTIPSSITYTGTIRIESN